MRVFFPLVHFHLLAQIVHSFYYLSLLPPRSFSSSYQYHCVSTSFWQTVVDLFSLCFLISFLPSFSFTFFFCFFFFLSFYLFLSHLLFISSSASFFASLNPPSPPLFFLISFIFLLSLFLVSFLLIQFLLVTVLMYASLSFLSFSPLLHQFYIFFL